MCGSNEEALASLIPHLNALEVLDLTTWGCPSRLLLHLTRLTNLRELIVRIVCIYYRDRPEFIAGQLLELGRCCKRLIRLHLEDPVNDREPIAFGTLNDDRTDELLSSMPQLEHLYFKFQPPEMSIETMTMIRRRYRDLRIL